MTRASAQREAVEVHLDAKELGIRARVGTLFRHATRTSVPASFEYDESWLKSDRPFALDPRLELWSGEQYPPDQSPVFGIFMDSAPDRWGRVLMERREAATARRERRKLRSLQELDFLLGVSDRTRVGALRFRAVEGGPFLDDSPNAAPPVTSLPELAGIIQRIEERGVEKLPEYERWIAMLIAPGTSLGGARPKASFSDHDGRLWIAKFPSHDDRYDVGAWELVVHRLAKRAGIWVPDARLENLTPRYGTFCVARFDRVGDTRRMFASAMTMLERRDGEENAGYLDLAQFLSDNGALHHVDGDLEQLFRRVVFNVLVGNRDDHLRNHGFIREPTGWRLAPAYDMNPNVNKMEHTLTFDGHSATPDLDLALETAPLYRLDAKKAARLLKEIRAVVATWRKEAKKTGLAASEVQQMERAFPH